MHPLTRIRHQLLISQVDLAQLACLTSATICRLEKRCYKPTIKTRSKLVSALKQLAKDRGIKMEINYKIFEEEN